MKKPMTRWKAAAIHLLISIVVITGVGLGLMFVWYGPELFSLMGALRLLTILGIIDVAIGPLLTLAVYKHGKKSLTFDLTVIALLQLGFLAYGMHIMWESRPVFLVGVLDRFELVFANQLSEEDLQHGRSEHFRTLSATGPRTVGGEMGGSSRERLDLALSAMAGRDVHLLPGRYVPYQLVAADIARSAKPISELIAMSDEESVNAIRATLEELGREESTVSYVPITSTRGRATMLLETGTGAVLDAVSVDPWPDLDN